MPDAFAPVPLQEVRIPCGAARLYGDLALPPDFAGLVLFAHGSGSGRHSARNRLVARYLQQAGIATLLFDLLTAQEEQVDVHTREFRFNIPLLTRRMEDAVAWVRQRCHAAITASQCPTTARVNTSNCAGIQSAALANRRADSRLASSSGKFSSRPNRCARR